MQDYELFKGAGQESSLTDKELDKLISENPKYALRFPQFPHFEMCCHISAGRKLEPRKRLRRMKKAAANRPTGRKSPSKSPQSRQSQQSNRAPETK
ncbi:unnamed protein product [Phytophthora lilii]|uniref:Unnamed protein product n=1 Tax=Phytophthora lilii TaxID=2077276 RepID=A0A9W6TQA4_9STRA|nr:unnamed protein product [Phytophthora lilii]